MTIEVAQSIAESHPDLLYIQMTAWATVALVVVTMYVTHKQLKAAKSASQIELSMRLIEHTIQCGKVESRLHQPFMRAAKMPLTAHLMPLLKRWRIF